MNTDFNRPWAAGLRSLIVLKLQQNGPQTTHELATACQVSPDAIAPRMTELEALGEAHDNGRRKSSVSGKGRKLKVWAAGEGEPEIRLNPGALADLEAETSEPIMRLL